MPHQLGLGWSVRAAAAAAPAPAEAPTRTHEEAAAPRPPQYQCPPHAASHTTPHAATSHREHCPAVKPHNRSLRATREQLHNARHGGCEWPQGRQRGSRAVGGARRPSRAPSLAEKQLPRTESTAQPSNRTTEVCAQLVSSSIMHATAAASVASRPAVSAEVAPSGAPAGPPERPLWLRSSYLAQRALPGRQTAQQKRARRAQLVSSSTMHATAAARRCS